MRVNALVNRRWWGSRSRLVRPVEKLSPNPEVCESIFLIVSGESAETRRGDIHVIERPRHKKRGWER